MNSPYEFDKKAPLHFPTFTFPHSFFIVLLLTCGSLSADDPPAARDASIVQTLLRLPSLDVNAKPKWKAAALRHLESHKGTARYVELVEKLKLTGVEERLLEMALRDPTGNVGVQAATLLLKRGEVSPFEQVIEAGQEPMASSAVTVLGLVGSEQSNELLQSLVTSFDVSRSLRIAATSGVGRNIGGQRFLLELARDGRLPAELQFTAANSLFGSADKSIRDEANQFLKLPAGVDSEPLPPVRALLKMPGDAKRGAILFRTTASCSKCHQVNNEGKEVGPDLSEIGSKLSPEAMFVSILDPSAGISHNYETYSAILNSGNIVTGVLVSRDGQTVTLRTADAIDKAIDAKDIEELVKNEVSLMPADLQKSVDLQGLVDVVTYLGELKKSGKVRRWEGAKVAE